MTYADFLAARRQLPGGHGFEPTWLPGYLHGFQRHLVDWAVRRGRAGVFADCGLGKTPMFLVWAENMGRHTNRPTLVVTTLGDTKQTLGEADKFQVEAVRTKDGKVPAGGARVVVVNYERLHLCDPDDYGAVAYNESSILKNFDGKTKAVATEFVRTHRYRLLCTATAAPNDFVELGTSAEALGEMGYADMLTRFFKQVTAKDYLGWGRTKYKVRGHAEKDFWRWVCSWARAVRKPSDLGYADGPFVLPPLSVRDHLVEARTTRPGYLFDPAAVSLQDQREEARRTLDERCEKVAEQLNGTAEPGVAWCQLNDEGDRLAGLVDGAVQVSGADRDEAKEEAFEAFAAGQIRVLVTKPTIAGFGLNWQHCARQTYFPSHSWEQYYQSVRRCWRFGQTRPVAVDVVTSGGQVGVVASLTRKQADADRMHDRLVALMADGLSIDREETYRSREEVPPWLSPINL